MKVKIDYFLTTTMKKNIRIALITLTVLVVCIVSLGVWVSGGQSDTSNILPYAEGGPEYRIYNSPDSTSPLKLILFVSQPQEINVTSPIVIGDKEAIVFEPQSTRSSANRLADVIEETGRELKYIYLGHAHMDHSQGASVLKQRFPNAKLIAEPKVAALQKLRIDNDDQMAFNRYGENAAIPSVPFEEYDNDKIFIEGHEIQLWHNQYGDVGIGHENEPHTVVYIPDLKALFPSDICYYGGHMMMGGSTKESRSEWKKQIRGYMEMDLEVVIPGHVPRTWTPHMTAQGVLEHSLEYIESYENALESSTSSDEVVDKMLKRYPKLEHTSALYLGTRINFLETHRLLFNPRLEAVMSLLPGSLVTWIDEKLWDSKKESLNL